MQTAEKQQNHCSFELISTRHERSTLWQGVLQNKRNPYYIEKKCPHKSGHTQHDVNMPRTSTTPFSTLSHLWAHSPCNYSISIPFKFSIATLFFSNPHPAHFYQFQLTIPSSLSWGGWTVGFSQVGVAPSSIFLNCNAIGYWETRG